MNKFAIIEQEYHIVSNHETWINFGCGHKQDFREFGYDYRLIRNMGGQLGFWPPESYFKSFSI